MSDPAPAPSPAPAPAGPKFSPDSTPLEVFFKGNRPLAAGALLILLQLVPSVGLFLALREGGGVWMVFALVLMGGALLPPLGVFLGQRWGYVLGQYVVWATLVGLVLRVLHTGFVPIYLAPAVVLGVLLVSLSPPRSSGGETKKTERKPDSFGVWLKENIEAIVIAFIMALVIRCFCIEVFKIPSSSMEPTLLGDLSRTHGRSSCPFREYHVPHNTDAASGDRIMVTKYYYAFSPVERYDVLVFKFPLNHAKNFIKRVVGLPEEYLKIHHGNLYVSKDKEKDFRIARRTMRTQDSIWIEPEETNNYLEKKETFYKSWEKETPTGVKGQAEPHFADGELSTQEVSGERSMSFSYKARSLDDASGMSVDNQRISFDVELTSPKGQVFAEIVNSYGRFETILDTDGTSWLHHYPPDKNGTVTTHPTVKADLKDVKLEMGRRTKLELSCFSGVAYVRVNDGERAKIQFIDRLDEIKEDSGIARRIAFGSRGATVRLRNLALGRDIFYRGKNNDTREGALRDDEALFIPKDCYLMMGDNVANSHDSRAWVKRTFELKDGRKIVCESQQVNLGHTDFNKHLQEKLGLPDVPDFGIDGDINGNDVAIFRDQLKSDTPEPFHFVEQKYIVGKALWIWWPQGRWFHLIR
jgi:signal peptidase I